MTRYQFEKSGKKVFVDVEWVGDGYEVRVGDQSWKLNPVDSNTDSSREVDAKAADSIERSAGQSGSSSEQEVFSPLSGKVLELYVAPGDTVEKGETLINLEAMKLESRIPAPCGGRVASVDVGVGQDIDEGTRIVTLEGA